MASASSAGNAVIRAFLSTFFQLRGASPPRADARRRGYAAGLAVSARSLPASARCPTPSARTSGLDLQRDVYRGCRVGDGADRHAVGAEARERVHAFDGDAAGDLHARGPLDPRD